MGFAFRLVVECNAKARFIQLTSENSSAETLLVCHYSNQELVPLTAIAAMPGATMRIYMGEPVDGRVAESVKIGDSLTLVRNLFCYC